LRERALSGDEKKILNEIKTEKKGKGDEPN